MVYIPFQRNNELGNSVSEIEILFFNEHNILCCVTYFRSDSGTLHSDMKQNICILLQTILKSSVVKEELSQAHLYIHTDMYVPANAIISVELKHSPE